MTLTARVKSEGLVTRADDFRECEASQSITWLVAQALMIGIARWQNTLIRALFVGRCIVAKDTGDVMLFIVQKGACKWRDTCD